MALVAPPAPPTSPLRRVADQLRAEQAAEVPLPPGELRPSLSRTHRFAREPLPILLSAYRKHGPVFSLRLLSTPVVFMLGPEANHYMTVSHASNFSWREGSMGDLIPLLGDGLLTTDGPVHRQARRIMLPAFHHDKIAASVDTMVAETLGAVEEWRPGTRLDLYAWTRRLALRIALRALFGADPDAHRARVDMAAEWERGLDYYGRDFLVQTLRGPGTPWARMRRARAVLDRVIDDEITRRRRDGGGQGEDLLSLLLHARDEEGAALADDQLRDQVKTLLFAGHDTTTATVSFLFYELGRNPAALARLLDEQDRVLGDRPPTAADLSNGLPELGMAVDETLRLYPAAWVGPRRALETFEFAGVPVPGGLFVNYCSWASQRLPEVFPDPEAFVPARFSPAARERLPKGAYVPFGGGSRTCIGMRFGLMEVKAIATVILQRFRLELEPGWTLTVRQVPTLRPHGGLPLTVRERDLPPALAA